jgi:hypothetical protein
VLLEIPKQLIGRVILAEQHFVAAFIPSKPIVD